MLTQSASIEALGPDSSGEAEPLLFFADSEWWLSVGSDHADRKVETYSVVVSKQLRAKPVANTAWRWADVAVYQNELELRSRILEDGEWMSYEKGTFGSIRPLAALRDSIYRAGGRARAFGRPLHDLRHARCRSQRQGRGHPSSHRDGN
ncbi:MAG: DUF2848 family protein [Janthinobacterium lividum]